MGATEMRDSARETVYALPAWWVVGGDGWVVVMACLVVGDG